MADPAPRPVKRWLGNVAMHVVCVRKRRDNTYSVLRWEIEKFLMLKDTVRYKWKAETLDCILKLDKKRYSITVTIESENYYPSIIGYVSYNESYDVSEPVPFEQVFKGVYKAQFGSKLVNNKDNEILKKHGRLELCFSYEVKLNFATYPRPYYEKRHPDDENSLACTVGNFLFCVRRLRILLSDFQIHVKKETYYVHKAILQTRSTFFNLYIDECCKDGKIGDIRIRKTKPEAMNVVLVYIYSGTMIIPKDVDLRIRIFMLAGLFQITNLRTAYLDLILRNINETNVVLIKNAGMSTGTRSLVEAADAYLSEYGRSISEEDTCWKTIENCSVISIQ